MANKMQPKLLNVNRTPHRPKKRKKITLVFDEAKRREFLQGFRKRKLQRQQRAKEELQKQLKEEKKRIKQEAHERYKKLVSSRDVPEIQQLLTENSYETEGHTVSIVELNMQDLSKKNALIGDNQDLDSNTEEETSDTESRQHGEEIVGMSLEEKEEKRSKSTRERTEKNGMDIKKEIKRTALKRVKSSKAFQLKQKLERQKNRKESLRKRKRVEKIRKRKGRKLKK